MGKKSKKSRQRKLLIDILKDVGLPSEEAEKLSGKIAQGLSKRGVYITDKTPGRRFPTLPRSWL